MPHLWLCPSSLPFHGGSSASSPSSSVVEDAGADRGAAVGVDAAVILLFFCVETAVKSQCIEGARLRRSPDYKEELRRRRTHVLQTQHLYVLKATAHSW